MLASGGLDSAVLIADLARSAVVHPVYVTAGLVWEADERAALRRFVDALASPNVRPVVDLSAPMLGLLGDSHWSIAGRGVPAADAPDEATCILGRNILLFSTVAIWCAVHEVTRVAIGSLGGNPFPDATPEFFESFGRSLSLGLGHDLKIEAPYRHRTKAALIAEHRGLPLGLTLTCANPRDGVHCGACNKCMERHAAFVVAGVPDETRYLAELAGR
ncbi:MAG: 7-cyano-7-deazaguanine synthase [Gemmatimonadaceae bacterium]